MINWNNPITKGLVFDHNPTERGGVFSYDKVNQTKGSIVSSGATWDNQQFGPDLDYSAAASSVNYATPTKVNTLTQMSYEFIFFSRGSGGGALGKIFQKGNTANAPYVIIQQSSSATVLEFLANWQTTTGNWTMTIVGSTWYHFVVTYNISSTANNPIMYLNGVSQALTKTGTPTGSAPADTANLYIGNSPTALRNFNGKIVYGRIWNRILTATEVKSLYSNPWQIYVKPAAPFLVKTLAAVVAAGNAGWKALMGIGL